MKALMRTKTDYPHGGIDCLVPIPRKPKPNTDEVLVRPRAAYCDCKCAIADSGRREFLGILSGVVDMVPEGNVTHDYKVGDAVCGWAYNCVADVVLADATRLSRMPVALTFLETCAMIAQQPFFMWVLKKCLSHIRSGDRVLVWFDNYEWESPAKAVVQIAKVLGAREIVVLAKNTNDLLFEWLTKMHEAGDCVFPCFEEEGMEHLEFIKIYALENENKFDVVFTLGIITTQYFTNSSLSRRANIEKLLRTGSDRNVEIRRLSDLRKTQFELFRAQSPPMQFIKKLAALGIRPFIPRIFDFKTHLIFEWDDLITRDNPLIFNISGGTELAKQTSLEVIERKISRLVSSTSTVHWRTYFLSHKQDESASLAMNLYHGLGCEGKPGAWLDVKNIATWPGKQAGIRECRIFVLILSPGYFNSGFCRKEFSYAIDLGKECIILFNTEVLHKKKIGECTNMAKTHGIDLVVWPNALEACTTGAFFKHLINIIKRRETVKLARN